MGVVQPLTVVQFSITSYAFDFQKPFTFAGTTLNQRTGYILEVIASDGLKTRGEIAPLPGVSAETLKKAHHDLVEAQPHLKDFTVVLDKDDLVASLRGSVFAGFCPSVRFGVESVLFTLAAQARAVSLAEFLGGVLEDVPTAALLQGPHEKILIDARDLSGRGYRVFKLKVGDRNVPLDVKKVQDLRALIGGQGSIRLDANRVWSLKEALLFVDLAGRAQIEFIEEPLSDMGKIGEFYQATHMPVALDESLSMFADSKAVKYYVLKPTVLGGVIPCLDWMEHARQQGKKVIISSAFESPVGLKVLANLACLTEKTAGLGTERWLKGVEPLADAGGMIRKGTLG
ncbi:MAG: o-succinylbenzoate synthase [Candidatus Omnitrophica bacterium]|nr:o-succinylbenzoate synthase [Candidatus Omnitrophota bacterium]